MNEISTAFCATSFAVIRGSRGSATHNLSCHMVACLRLRQFSTKGNDRNREVDQPFLNVIPLRHVAVRLWLAMSLKTTLIHDSPLSIHNYSLFRNELIQIQNHIRHRRQSSPLLAIKIDSRQRQAVVWIFPIIQSRLFVEIAQDSQLRRGGITG